MKLTFMLQISYSLLNVEYIGSFYFCIVQGLAFPCWAASYGVLVSLVLKYILYSR